MGDDMLFEIYKKLGQVEIEDQIDVTTQLIHTYKFIDQSKVRDQRFKLFSTYF